jgi:hypothetical protein
MAIDTHSEIQVHKSYTVEFSATSDSYPANDYPNSYLVIQIYDNDTNALYHSHTVTDLSVPGNLPYPYTFNSNDVGSYNVVYKVYSGDPNVITPDPDESSELAFTVYEYKPTFSLPTVTCAELNIPFTFYPTNWFFNNNDLCPATPINNGDYQVEYKRYEFNLNTSTYDLKNTVTLTIDPADIINEEVEGELQIPEMYAYEWTPSALAMVKIVVTINNCSEFVEKATVFPICGSWKIRRLSCGNYRIYNYKNDNITYDLYNDLSSTAFPSVTNIVVPAFSYVELPLPVDGIYKIIADNITQYIFNFCKVENCIFSLQKQILLDDTLCDDCKMDKVLYQKALRLISIYETWKKLLDKDNVYSIQYTTTDQSDFLASLYDVNELYTEIMLLCEGCTDSQKPCGC